MIGKIIIAVVAVGICTIYASLQIRKIIKIKKGTYKKKEKKVEEDE